jgi:hypothetical protein
MKDKLLTASLLVISCLFVLPSPKYIAKQTIRLSRIRNYQKLKALPVMKNSTCTSVQLLPTELITRQLLIVNQ